MQTAEFDTEVTVYLKDVMDIMHKYIEPLLGYATLLSVAYAYPITIFDVYTSSLANKIYHCVLMASFSCPVQGSFLLESTKRKPKINDSDFWT